MSDVLDPATTIERKAAAPELSFRGGPLAGVVPIAVFLVATITLVIYRAPVVEGMILAAMLGISCGMFLARDVAAYSEHTFTLMANRVATVAVVCWLWAGAFSGILADSGLVEAIVWLGWKMQLTGGWLVMLVFISAAFFATSVGTGMGTIMGFTAVMYPAAVLLGGHPPAVIGAIISGAAFGDNLAPISDTTIVSAATQETDVGGVVRSRLKYVLATAVIASVLFVLTGEARRPIAGGDTEQLLSETAHPSGLPMLIPSVVVFLVAISGRHFLGALTLGVASALIIGPLFGVFPLERVFHITESGMVGGSAVEGALGLMPTAILTLLLVTAIGIMEASGFLEAVLVRLQGFIGKSIRRAELAIVGLVGFANICVSTNTVAMITTGPLANVIRKQAGIHPYRSANLLDTISCSFPFILPYATAVVAAVAMQRQVAERYPSVPVVGWAEFAPYFFYGHILFPLMLLAILTGFGRRQG
jgi:Na+/H+ antiporter NhaC